MARRMIKFPLKMKNCAEVRNLEELRENADVESIMKYYFSGQLSLWCKAYGYENIPTGISEISETFVKSVMDLIGVKASAEEIQEYIKNSFGAVDTSKITEDIENEEEIIDNADIKDKLKEYTDINLDDYEISVVPFENENGKIEKYRVRISCEKTGQYTRFEILYNITTSYTVKRFQEDINRKVINCIRRLEEEAKYNKSNFITLEVGDKFCMGRWKNKVIEWQVVKKEFNSAYVLCTDTIDSCEFSLDIESNDWQRSEIRRWLNNDFYNIAFSAGEKEFIGNVSGDKITLLTKNEAEQLIDLNEIMSSPNWWLRSPNTCRFKYTSDVYYHVFCVKNDKLDYYPPTGKLGIRPAFEMRF